MYITIHFFGSCNLYYEEVYIGEGEYDIRPVRVERISEACSNKQRKYKCI